MKQSQQDTMMAQTSLDQGGSSEGGRMWLDSESFKDRVGEKSQGSFCNFQFSSVQFSRPVVSDSLRPHESQHTRPPCPSQTP